MCGVAGVISTQRPIADKNRFQAMSDAIRHRGPDGTGYFFSPDDRIALMQHRLAIIDLSDAGRQPMHTPDGRLTVVFNGEIYNYIELRRELEAAGRSFVSESDTEIILQGHAHWGTGVLNRLRGMFMFALYDRATDEVVIARDRLGIKPVFYSNRDGEVAFCSELDALRCYEPGGAIDRQSLGKFLRYRYVSGANTIWHGLYKLEPGHFLKIEMKSGKVTKSCFWDLASIVAKGARSDPDEFEERFGTTMEQHIRADVPVGVLLSGGLDSTAVLRTLRTRNPGQKISTFSVGFGDARSELGIARNSAAKYGTEHHEILLAADDLETSIDMLAARYGEPLADSSAIPMMRLSEAVGKHVKVALGGDGGDELFGGYRWYQAAEMMRLVPKMPMADTVSSFLEDRSTAWRLMKGAGLGGQCRFDFLHGASFSPSEIAGLVGRTDSVMNAGYDDRLPEYQRLRLYDLQSFTVDSVLYKVDVASMAYALEARVPLLDHEMVEWAMGLPPKALYSPSQTKRLLRNLDPPLPAEVTAQGKTGFSLPLRAWADKIIALAEDSFRRSVAVEAGLLTHEGVRKVFDTPSPDQIVKLWTLTVFERWYRSRAT